MSMCPRPVRSNAYECHLKLPVPPAGEGALSGGVAEIAEAELDRPIAVELVAAEEAPGVVVCRRTEVERLQTSLYCE